MSKLLAGLVKFHFTVFCIKLDSQSFYVVYLFVVFVEKLACLLVGILQFLHVLLGVLAFHDLYVGLYNIWESHALGDVVQGLGWGVAFTFIIIFTNQLLGLRTISLVGETCYIFYILFKMDLRLILHFR